MVVLFMGLVFWSLQLHLAVIFVREVLTVRKLVTALVHADAGAVTEAGLYRGGRHLRQVNSCRVQTVISAEKASRELVLQMSLKV